MEKTPRIHWGRCHARDRRAIDWHRITRILQKDTYSLKMPKLNPSSQVIEGRNAVDGRILSTNKDRTRIIISFEDKAHDDCSAVHDRAANDGVGSNGHGGQHVKTFPSSSSSSMPGKSRVRGKGGPASGMSSTANSDQNTKRATNSRRPPLSKGKTSSRTSGRENEGRKLYHSLTVPVSTTFATERLKHQRALAKSERNANSLNGDSRAKASQSTGNDGSARLPLSHKNAHQVTNFMIDRKAV